MGWVARKDLTPVSCNLHVCSSPLSLYSYMRATRPLPAFVDIGTGYLENGLGDFEETSPLSPATCIFVFVSPRLFIPTISANRPLHVLVAVGTV